MTLPLAPEHCPQCGGPIDVQFDVETEEPVLSAYMRRGEELPRRKRIAPAVAFCNGCEFAVEVQLRKE